MTDAHTHVDRGDARSFVCDPAGGRTLFAGLHPWRFLSPPDGFSLPDELDCLRGRLAAEPSLGVGEIGLDRLKAKQIPPPMRQAFLSQLEIAAEFSRPVVLHGTKCWGQVAEACRPFAGKIPAFLFHGFSRSGGLLPEIAKMNGFVSVGPAVLNDHAVNYRELVKAIPREMLLLESDATAETAGTVPFVAAVAAKVAELRGVSLDEIESVADANASRFASASVLADASGERGAPDARGAG